MILSWAKFCKQKGVDFAKFNRGIDILMKREPDGSRPNIEYYMSRGWQALLNAVESEDKQAKE